MTKCPDCGTELNDPSLVRCARCSKKKTRKRKYKRRHEHRKRLAGL